MKVMKITTAGYDVKIVSEWQMPWCEDWLYVENRDRVIWEDGEWCERPLGYPPATIWEAPNCGFDGGVGYMQVIEENGNVHEYIIESLDGWAFENNLDWDLDTKKFKELVVGRDKFENVTVKGYCF